MRFSTLTAILLPLGALASPVATPIEAEVSATQAGHCDIVVPFGASVNCHAGPDDKTFVVYKFSTALYVPFECYTTKSGSAWYRTKSNNGVCQVKEKDLVEGPLCRGNILGVIC
ncbi:hypothetical protein EG327_009957 [Venturia inaequalis]|uniref:Small secreted protein n=1 Tax=Venturia inaequalis TaxID=5025 RepID=A0A8H3UJH3_VENIN|nr:hypothetical protein EG327_009957 [Venturia inaequalis]